jgi:FKBP-type peptidyl-prolyl cis-trans isomerase
MSESKTTSLYVIFSLGLALLTAVLLAANPYRRDADVGVFGELGQTFYPDFNDPTQCTAMEVAAYNESASEVLRFKVALEKNRWVIPSHHNYPADAKDRLIKVAANYLGVKKDAVATDLPSEYAKLEVLDPLDEKETAVKGRGRRLTLKDKSGSVLCDFIIGKSVPDQSGFHYVRVPGKNRVYISKIESDISTKFEDWIETDLLKLNSGDVRRVKFNLFSIDEFKGTIRDPEMFEAEKDPNENKWTLKDLREAEEELKPDPLNALTSALDDLKIVGIRPKPAQFIGALGKTFTPTPSADNIKSQLINLASGFYFAPDKGYALGNQGQISVETKDGLVYDFYFGNMAHGSGLALTAGGKDEVKKSTGKEKKDAAADDDEADKDDAEDENENATAKGENRYVMVTVKFNSALLPPEPTAPAEPPKKTADAATDKAAENKDEEKSEVEKKKEEEEKREREAYESAKAEYERQHKEWVEKKKTGEDLAKELSARFRNWYYVVANDAFNKIRLHRADLVKIKEKTPEVKETVLPSGLKIADLKDGEGAEAKKGHTVRVHYTGTLTDGRKFDSSVDRNDPFEFKIGAGQVIKGWDEGVPGMKVGGKRKLVIPSALGYGPKGSPPMIPGNAELTFEIELLSIVK